MKIYPSKFEYNNTMLLYLCDNLYSCRFGNFLCNNEKENNETSKTTISIFSYISKYSYLFKNPLYEYNTEVLIPTDREINCNLSLWKEYFLRWKCNNDYVSQYPSLINENNLNIINNLSYKMELKYLRENLDEEVEYSKFENYLENIYPRTYNNSLSPSK